MTDFEGKPGDQNYKLNNPGNVRYNPGGYLPKYGKVTRSANNFAIFTSPALGWLYLQNMVLGMVKNHPNWTFRDFFFSYAPPADNNPSEAYARNVAKRCGVPVDSKVADYLAK